MITWVSLNDAHADTLDAPGVYVIRFTDTDRRMNGLGVRKINQAYLNCLRVKFIQFLYGRRNKIVFSSVFFLFYERSYPCGIIMCVSVPFDNFLNMTRISTKLGMIVMSL